MSNPRPLTRKELAEFLPSLRAIKAFEQLLDIVGNSGNLDIGSGTSALSAITSLVPERYEFIEVTGDFSPFCNSFLNVTTQCLITLNSTPLDGEQIIVHKNTGLLTDYVEVTDGTGTDRLVIDQTVLSYRYSIELNQWIRGS